MKSGSSDLQSTPLSQLRYFFISMRPRQWTKNIFVFAGLVFSGQLSDPVLLSRVVLGFLLFSFASSSIYILNDLVDLNNDRKHPEKRKRPLAAGNLKIGIAYWGATLLFLMAVAGSVILDATFLLIVLVYCFINLAYSFVIKHMVILDILTIAFGFVLRVLAGTALAGVRPSDWLIVCTLMVSLFLGFSKRRQELTAGGEAAGKQRKVLKNYSAGFLDQMIGVVTACTVLSYALYTISPETVQRFGSRDLVFTVPFVLYGVFRYLYLVYHVRVGENPTSLVTSDVPFLINALLWLGCVIWIIY